MSESKQRICKFPKCTKETFDKNALFCGEHEREFKDFKDKAGKAASGMAILAMTFIAKKVLEKKL